MDPNAFSAGSFMWNLRGMGIPPNRVRPEPEAVAPPQAAPAGFAVRSAPWEPAVSLEDMFQAYGVRFFTVSKIGELGFTVHTLVRMKDEEIENMTNYLSQYFRVDLLVGEKYGIKAAVRAQRRLVTKQEMRQMCAVSGDTTTMDASSQQGLTSEEAVQQEKEMVGSIGGAAKKRVAAVGKRKRVRRGEGWHSSCEEQDDGVNGKAARRCGAGEILRQRDHPFIVTEPGEVARGKKNGLDYLFHLYEQCQAFLTQVQDNAKDSGEACPSKVTNKVFRFAKKSGATNINKPKMRQYVHCYALHCLDLEQSIALRRECKLRGDNIGTWRQKCYKPVVEIAANNGWDIDAIFRGQPQLAIWYVPTKLRQLCHAERNKAAAATSASGHSGTALL